MTALERARNWARSWLESYEHVGDDRPDEVLYQSPSLADLQVEMNRRRRASAASSYPSPAAKKARALHEVDPPDKPPVLAEPDERLPRWVRRW